MEFRKLLQDVVNNSYEELVSVAKKVAPNVLNIIDKETSNDKEFVNVFRAILASVICVDGVVNRKEHELYNDVFCQNLSYDAFNDLFKDNNSSKLRDSVNSFVDHVGYSYGTDAKNDFIILFMCFAAANETISKEEVQYLYDLLK